MKIISNISSIASIIAFLFLYNNEQSESEISTFQYLTLIIFFGASIFMLVLEYLNRPKKYKNENEIANYMKNWVSKIGRTVIFTRDMSWANTQEIKNKLLAKSHSNELIICLPKKTDLVHELEKAGAQIIEYKNLNYEPTSRFTIVHYGRNDSKLAIGRTNKKGEHEINEFENGTHTQFHLAEDLVNVLKEISNE